MPFTAQDELAVNAIRVLSIDAIEKSNSGHPGLPLGAAPMAYVLWSRFLKHNPKNPKWFDRDRFVLSAGHGSMLLYSLLHLSGYDLPMEELKNFRQWGSKTPGHPEFGHTVGVEATTGPLGQGISMAVGMAIAEQFMASTFNKQDHKLVDHNTYVIVGDGDLMEGVSQEAASLAGHLGLNKLIVLYDSNNITLDGPAELSFSENVADRFRAYGWNVLRVDDGNDLDAIEQAITQANTEQARPTLIEVKTVIGYGSPKQGTSKVHGSPLGAEGAEAAKQAYGWNEEPFSVPDEVYAAFAKHNAESAEREAEWNAVLSSYRTNYKAESKQFDDALSGVVNVDFDNVLPAFEGGVATRDAFGKIINAIAPHVPTLLGGSADLSSSNKTLLDGAGSFQKGSYEGRNVFYGVREHAMGAAMNGISLHGGVIPFGGTFLVFVDYLRPAVRLSALMKQPVMYVMTHDSIAVGEDGPTHEPVEQLASLRVIPGVRVFRPADATETGLSVRYALEHRDAPTVLALSRQKLPTLDEVKANRQNFNRGAYVIYQHGSGTDLILMASGSEVQLALQAGKKLASEGVQVRVVSAPSLDVFEEQPNSYREEVLPANVRKRLAVEMAQSTSWYKYVGLDGEVIGIDTFGASAPGEIVMREYGFTEDRVIDAAKSLLNR
ncbi:transketolase [Alicyclobacillus dauci]|uniref:Transketolase n=1 Tax=Alicyclobacillus dauci TaxID=1475485 RepID=A0ABY6Z9P7_9BACL|nr:transketolase [Alicyclobacillus dauci]WAH38891.1 transketolase [Alicyclobacillus dauci]